jgi:hypothetical protein
MDWFTDITTANFYNWGLLLYVLCVLATLVYLPYLGYKVGFAKGYQKRQREEKPLQPPARFRQRTAEADPRRFARISRARVIARRQRTPEPRRGKPADS